MIFLIDKYNNADIIDYTNIKSRRVVRSVLEAETFALADTYDIATIIQHDLKNISGKH